MIASVGMAVCKRAATPTVLHEIAEYSMTCVMSVVQSVRSAVMPQSVARRPTATSTSADAHEQRETEVPRGEPERGSNKQLFFLPAKAGLFERPKAAFCTVETDGVMPRMTPSATTAFYVYVNPL